MIVGWRDLPTSSACRDRASGRGSPPAAAAAPRSGGPPRCRPRRTRPTAACPACRSPTSAPRRRTRPTCARRPRHGSPGDMKRDEDEERTREKERKGEKEKQSRAGCCERWPTAGSTRFPTGMPTLRVRCGKPAKSGRSPARPLPFKKRTLPCLDFWRFVLGTRLEGEPARRHVVGGGDVRVILA